MFRRSALALALATTLVLGGACSSGKSKTSAGSEASSTSTSAAPALTGNLTVLAAASLTDSFNELGKAFEAAHSDTKVTFSYDASSSLATQADNGAPADLFASADQPNMKKVTDPGNATDAKAAAATADGVAIDDKDNVVAEYPMAVLKQSKNQNLAYAFLDYILGPDAQAILAKYGFTGP